MALSIRDITERDIEGKARAHWASWHETYTGLVDQAFLDALTYEKCLAIAKRYPEGLVAELDGQIIGFALCGPCRDDDLAESGEVYAIYVLKSYHRKGIGYALMNACLDKLKDNKQIAVWVLSGNQTAIEFYQRYGFVFDGRQKEITLGKPVMESRMIFKYKDQA